MSIKASDQITITDITDSYSIVLSSDSYSFIGDKDGAIIGDSCFVNIIGYIGKERCSNLNLNLNDIKIYNNNREPISNNKYVNIKVFNSGTDNIKVLFEIISTLNEVINVNLPIKINDIIIEKIFSISVSKQGIDGKRGENGQNGKDGKDGEDAISLSILSTNGTIFKNDSDSTMLTAYVYKSGSSIEINENGDIENIGTINWFKNGENVGKSKSITISANSINKESNKESYSCKIINNNIIIQNIDITISLYRDTNNITRLYKLIPINNPIPNKPNTKYPNDWDDTEPTYIEGNDDILYFVDRYIFSDGTYQYTEVSKSSSYELAKKAKDSIDNLEIGGTNFITDSIDDILESKYSGSSKNFSSDKVDIKLEKLEPNKEYTFSFDVDITNFKGTNYGFESIISDGVNSFKITKYLNDSNLSKRVYVTFITPEWVNIEDYNNYYPNNELLPNNNLYPMGSHINDIKGKFYINGQTSGEVILKKPKLELGNTYTDWSPSPEDIEQDLEYTNEQVSNAYDLANKVNINMGGALQRIDSIERCIKNLVIDDNNMTSMLQTGDGWSLNMSSLTNNLKELKEALENAMTQEDGESMKTELENLIDSVEKRTAYINVTTFNGAPAIILGATDSFFKVRITNVSIDFLEGENIIAYANGSAFYNLRTVVQQDIQIGGTYDQVNKKTKGPGFIWKTRESGNLGLTYVE